MVTQWYRIDLPGSSRIDPFLSIRFRWYYWRSSGEAWRSGSIVARTHSTTIPRVTVQCVSCHSHERTKQIFMLSTWPPLWQYHGNQMLRKGSINMYFLVRGRICWWGAWFYHLTNALSVCALYSKNFQTALFNGLPSRVAWLVLTTDGAGDTDRAEAEGLKHQDSYRQTCWKT